MDKNKEVYEDQKISSRYFGWNWLFPPEKKFLQTLDKSTAPLHMLDVGIGGGRTTYSFAPKVARYTGIDYSGAMIRYCKRKYQSLNNVELFEMDARDLSAFPDEHFDIVLFSFNGIDCVDYEGRTLILSEFRRVLKPGGTLLFSFHNVRHLYNLYSFQMPNSPFTIPWELKRIKMLHKLNGPPSQYVGKEIFSMYDGADNFHTLIFYLLPEKQLKDLHQAGFELMQWWDLKSGKTIESHQLIDTVIPWIFVQAHKL